MHYKGFNVLIQRRFSEFFFVHNFHLLGSGQSLGRSIGSLDKFFLDKLDVYIAEGQEGHS